MMREEKITGVFYVQYSSNYWIIGIRFCDYQCSPWERSTIRNSVKKGLKSPTFICLPNFCNDTFLWFCLPNWIGYPELHTHIVQAQMILKNHRFTINPLVDVTEAYQA